MKTFTVAILYLCLSFVFVHARTDSSVAVIKKTRLKAYAHITALPSQPAPLEKGASVVLVVHPLRGAFVKRDFDSAASRLAAFLDPHACTRIITPERLLANLTGHSDSGDRARYCILPLEIKTVRKERKASVQNVVKLDKEGNFVPSSAGLDLSSTTVCVRVRYVAVDLQSITIPWSVHLTATASSDDFLMEEEAVVVSGPVRRRNDQSYRCVMYIVEKVKEKLAREFR
jgi:hypothetical protein